MSYANDGGYIICGTQDFSNTIIYKTNASGDSIWRAVLHENTYSEYGKSVLQLNDTSLICIGANDVETTIYLLDNYGIQKAHKSIDSVSISEIIKYDSNSIALIGTKKTEDYNSDIYYAVYNDELQIVTEKQYGG